MKLDPKALAECPSDFSEPREGVQTDVDDEMVYAYVISIEALPRQSARPFSEYVIENWFDYNEEPGDLTNEKLIDGALEFWRGQ